MSTSERSEASALCSTATWTASAGEAPLAPAAGADTLDAAADAAPNIACAMAAPLMALTAEGFMGYQSARGRGDMKLVHRD